MLKETSTLVQSEPKNIEKTFAGRLWIKVSPSTGEWVGGDTSKTALRKLNFESVNSLNYFRVLIQHQKKLQQVIIVLVNQLRNTTHHCFSENLIIPGNISMPCTELYFWTPGCHPSQIPCYD